MSRQHTIWAIVGVVILGIICWVYSTVFLNDKKNGPNEPVALQKVEVARTDAQRTLGLSGRVSIAPDYGMLFIFDTSDRHSFWMKDMNFPIDIIWLDAFFKVVHVESSVFPQSYPKVFTPDQKSSFVLEVADGIAEKNNYREGAVLHFLSDHVYSR